MHQNANSIKGALQFSDCSAPLCTAAKYAKNIAADNKLHIITNEEGNHPMENEKHTIAMLVNNAPGVLSRVSGIFGRLGYNIESLCVAETNNQGTSRITLVSRANPDFTEKVVKQLNKLVDVIEVHEFNHLKSIQREMMLIGIKLDEGKRKELMQATGMFGCKIVYMDSGYCILEVIGSKNDTDTVLNYMKPFGIEEIARTGIIALQQKCNNS